jgi:fumarate reductase subunit D
MSGWLLLAIGAFVTAMDLAVGLYLMRRGADATALDADPSARLAAEASARAGRLILLLSPIFFLVFAALACGLIPLEGIEPISLGSAS